VTAWGNTPGFFMVAEEFFFKSGPTPDVRIVAQLSDCYLKII